MHAGATGGVGLHGDVATQLVGIDRRPTPDGDPAGIPLPRSSTTTTSEASWTVTLTVQPSAPLYRDALTTDSLTIA